MKKLVLALAGVMLAGSLFAFTGCDDLGNAGVIKGNYKDVTLAEATEAVKNIDMKNAFGDSTQEGFKVGFEEKMNLTFDIGYETIANLETLSKVNLNGSLKANYQVVMEQGGKSLSLTGKGDLSESLNTSSTTKGIKIDNETKVDSNIYLDSKYIYLDMHASVGELKKDEKIKYELEDALETVLDKIGDVFTVVDKAEVELPGMGITGGVDVNMNLGNAISALVDAGFTVSLDQSSGLKIKISAGKELILSALKKADLDFPDSLEGLDLVFSEVALYLSFNKDGKFVQGGFNVNVAAKLDAVANGTGTKAELSIMGGVELKLFKGTVTLPEDLKDYKEQDFKFI